MKSIVADIRDLEKLQSVIAKNQPEIIFHLAAQAIVRASYDDPVFNYTTNVIGTMNVLEAARTADNLRVAVMVTSDKCYQNNEQPWSYRENDELGGKDPYSNSKACAELIIGAYRESFFPNEKYDQHGLALASARAGNVIGGDDWAKDRLIPDVVNAICSNRTVMIRRPNSTRPWQFVLAALHGYLILAEKLWDSGPKYANSWNFGPDSEDIQTVGWIADYLTKKWGDGADWQFDSADHPPEASFLMLDSTMARRELGWRRKLKLSDSLDWILEWQRAFATKQTMHDILIEQINQYEELK